jgi:hypothetical protein
MLPIAQDRIHTRVASDPLQNRFVGADVLYGHGSGWGPPQEEARGEVIVHDIDTGTTSRLALRHGVDRIEVMGRDAVVIGAGGNDLHFTPPSSMRARRSSATTRCRTPRKEKHGATGSSIDRKAIRQGCSDSQFEADPKPRTNSSKRARRASSSCAPKIGASPLGTLSSRGAEINDACVASCVDWYGNTRPIFYRNRIFALLGYELVEGRIDGSAIHEVRRTNYFPSAPRRQ